MNPFFSWDIARLGLDIRYWAFPIRRHVGVVFKIVGLFVDYPFEEALPRR